MVHRKPYNPIHSGSDTDVYEQVGSGMITERYINIRKTLRNEIKYYLLGCFSLILEQYQKRLRIAIRILLSFLKTVKTF